MQLCSKCKDVAGVVNELHKPGVGGGEAWPLILGLWNTFTWWAVNLKF